MTARRALSVLLALVAVAAAVFLALNVSALYVHGFARADAGDVVWTAACGLTALAGLAAARRLWTRPTEPQSASGGARP